MGVLLVPAGMCVSAYRGTNLVEVIESGDLVGAKLRLAFGDDPHAVGERGAAPLHSAARLGYVDIARRLLEHGADIDAASNQGARPLHEAVMIDDEDVARFLIEKGADINARHEYGTPLDWAVMFGRKDIADLLRRHNAAGAAHAVRPRAPGVLVRGPEAREPWPHKWTH